MTNHQIQENFTFPQETYQAIGVTYYRKIPPHGNRNRTDNSVSMGNGENEVPTELPIHH